MEKGKPDSIYYFLKHRKYWKELIDDVLKEIGEIYKNDLSDFNDFVRISEHYNLTQANYLRLQEGFSKPKELIPYFALTLERCGAMLMEEFSKSDDGNYKEDAKECYQLSLKLNPFLVPSYGALAYIFAFSDNNVEIAIDYCNKGIKAFKNLRKIPHGELSNYNKALLSDPSAFEHLKELKSELIGKK